MDPFMLGQLLQSMGPGQVGGMPQMAPPPGIPWDQPPAAPAPPPPVMRSPNAGMNPVQAQVPQPRPAPPPGGYSAPQAGQDIMSAFAQFLQENRGRWAEEDRNAAEDARGAENTPAKPVKSGGELPSEMGFNADPFADIGKPSVQPAAPAAPSPSVEPLSMFDVYGAPMPTKRPLDLGSMLYSDSNVPIPEKAPGQAPVPGAAPVPLPTQKGAPAAPPPATPTSAQASKKGTPGAVAAPSGGRGSVAPPFQNAPNTDLGQPRHEPFFDNDTAKFLLQAGLNMMVPSWGGPLANIGQAVGAGAEAVGRGREADQKTKLDNAKLDVERARVSKMGLGKKGAGESSSSKRLKEKTPQQRIAAGLSPEGAMFFQTRLKQMNKMAAPDDEGNTPDASNTFDQIMAETKRVDSRARMGRGQLKSEEIPDADIAKAAATPALETQMLNWVASDPVQRQLTATRLQNAKVKASGGTSAKPNG